VITIEILDQVKEELPKDAMISEIVFEGSEIILYTKNREFFRENISLIKKIVSKIKKRIEVRSDKSILETEERRSRELGKLFQKKQV